MSTYKDNISKVKQILGSYQKIGVVCGVSGIAVQKWHAAGRPPRTEYTGETDYASAISKAVDNKVSRKDLVPEIVRPQ